MTHAANEAGAVRIEDGTARILHLSDVHFNRAWMGEGACARAAGTGFFPGLLTRLGDTRAYVRAAVLDAAAGGSIDAVVLTGDITHAGDAQDHRLVRAALQNALAEVGYPAGTVPMLAVPGNHDDRAAFRAAWCCAGADDGACADSPVRARLDLPSGLALVALDTSDPERPDGRVDAGELAWLDRELADIAQSGREAIIVTHHHLCPSQSDMPACEGAAQVAGALHGRGCAGVLCGHTHHAASGMAHGVPYWTAPSLSFAADASLRDEVPWLFEPQTAEAQKVVRFYESWGYSVHEVTPGGAVRSQAVTHTTGRLLGDLVL